MKKAALILLILVFVIALILPSCSEKTTVAPEKSAFMVGFQAEYNELSISGKLSESENGGYKLTIDKPETLSGMTAVFENNGVKLSFCGIDFNFGCGEIGEQAFVSTVCGVIDSVLSGSSSAEKTDSGFLLKGNVGDTAYELTLDSEHRPLSLKTSGEFPLALTFSK